MNWKKKTLKSISESQKSVFMVITTAATNASEYLPCARRENVFVFKKGNYTL